MIDPQVHLDSLRRKSMIYLVIGLLAGFITVLALMSVLAAPTLPSGGGAYAVGAILGRAVVVIVPLIVTVVCFRARQRARSDREKVHASIERDRLRE